MTKSIDFYFDFISPYSYLAHKKIKYLKKKDKIIFNYKPILLGGLLNLEGITAPAFIKPKLNHMITDCELIAKKNNFDFKWNSKFPINSLSLMRGYLVIDAALKDLYTDIIFDAYWRNNINISDKKELMNIITKCKIDMKDFTNGINNQEIKDELTEHTKNAHEKNIFGAPTFVINKKIFWGQDRLDFAIDEYYG